MDFFTTGCGHNCTHNLSVDTPDDARYWSEVVFILLSVVLSLIYIGYVIYVVTRRELFRLEKSDSSMSLNVTYIDV
ncbi:hypothetical protein L596_021025 [Steinernema carpocapsae]|uniref:Uncharacterized protein n=1 Tax=Steinernema carpocapsae TaxID=34508 RepID=A0A4U5MV94_STECR|nr:hypothetical protein L596_021025 [Steinernema carpocapsae]